MEPITIQLPPITITHDPIKKWCWRAPNGATGTHETTAVQAASVAIAGMGCRPSEVDMTAAKAADDALISAQTPKASVFHDDTVPK